MSESDTISKVTNCISPESFDVTPFAKSLPRENADLHTSAEIISTGTQMTKTSDYGYDHISMDVIFSDMRFSTTALKPGQILPNTDLATRDGGEITLYELVTKKALVIITGSITCPMALSSLAELNSLQAQFGDDISFVHLYVREAHPGENYCQTHEHNQKISNANDFAKRHSINWPVVIDDMDGTLHGLLDVKPNSVHLINGEGEILFQALWAGDSKGLKTAITQLVNDIPVTNHISKKCMGPLFRGLGFMDEILKLAGPQALREFLMVAPPIAVLSKVASLFSFLPQSARAYAAVLSVISVAAIGVVSFI